MCVFVCERERVCVCGCERESVCVYVCVRVRERGRAIESECVREREGLNEAMNARLSGHWGKLFPNMHIQVRETDSVCERVCV